MIRVLFTLLIIAPLITSCSDKVYNFTTPTEETETGSETDQTNTEPSTQIIISSGDINHRGVSSYGTDGTFIKQILDLKAFGSTPNGLSVGPDGTFLMSTDGADSILKAPYTNDYSFFYGSALLNGGIYDIEYNPILDYY